MKLKCPRCEGTGKVLMKIPHADAIKFTCTVCEGTGFANSKNYMKYELDQIRRRHDWKNFMSMLKEYPPLKPRKLNVNWSKQSLEDMKNVLMQLDQLLQEK
jgi:hypothetical protein